MAQAEAADSTATSQGQVATPLSQRLASLRRRFAGTSLRARLVAGILVLVAIGLVIANVAAAVLLRNYLMDRTDQQLVRAAQTEFPWWNRNMPRDNNWWWNQQPAPRGQQLPTDFVAVVYDAEGNVRNRFPDDAASFAIPTIDSAEARERAGIPFTIEGADPAEDQRAIVEPLGDGGESVLLAIPLGDVSATVQRLLTLSALVSIAVLALVAALALLVVRLGLRPLTAMEDTAEAIAAGDLSRRVPDADPRTEVGRLGTSMNAMLTQIEDAFAQRTASEDRLRQFVADASHELRTPLTSIRGYSELYRQGAVTDADEMRRLTERIEDEAKRMGLLVDDLLLLARLDQQRPLEREPVDLTVLAADAVQDARAIEPARPIDLGPVNGSGSWGERPLVVIGDEARLRQVLGNLVNNALVHTSAETPVHVRLGMSPGEDLVALEVADEGPGLPPDQASRVFERFYRADPSRSRAHGGSGLGLSIVSAIAAAHGGWALCESAPGKGTRFRVVLPAAPEG
jgi:two-component system, OmpR family, sensor kinase